MTQSQYFAAGVTFAAVFVMLAPLRRGPDDMQTRQASFIPLLGAGGVAETNAFRRLDSARPEYASAEPQVRAPTAARRLTSTHRSSHAPLPHDFSSPRVSWTHLTASHRTALDDLISRRADWQAIELHGSHVATAGQIDRLHRRVRGAGGHPYQLLITADGLTIRPDATAGVMHLCLAGALDHESSNQLAILDEVADYLAMKLGQISMHSHSCLRESFPAQEIINALTTKR